MTASAALQTLLGAALVAIGVLAAALADRIRGLRVSRDPRASTHAARTIEVVEPASDVPAVKRRAPTPRATRDVERIANGCPPSQVKMESMADEVIAALVATGYKKPIATEAVWGCGAGERASIEGWTAAALRRCARGGLS